MLVWDNQQATNWFVGILEGEGSFYDRSETNKRVIIPNNDKDLIYHCEQFLLNNRVLFKTYVVKAGKKVGYKLTVTGQDCINLYHKILHTMECRKNEFQHIMGASETECSLSIVLPWLIGIFEAEGSYCLSVNHRGHITPKIELDNTNERIIRKIANNLHKLGLSWYVKDYFPEKRKPYAKITIQGVKRCKHFTQETIDLWRCEKNIQRSKLMLAYCVHRLAKPVNSGYDATDFEFVNRMRQLNG